MHLAWGTLLHFRRSYVPRKLAYQKNAALAARLKQESLIRVPRVKQVVEASYKPSSLSITELMSFLRTESSVEPILRQTAFPGHAIINILPTHRQRSSLADLLVQHFKQFFLHKKIVCERSEDWIVADLEVCMVHFIDPELAKEVSIGETSEEKAPKDVLNAMQEMPTRKNMGSISFLDNRPEE